MVIGTHLLPLRRLARLGAAALLSCFAALIADGAASGAAAERIYSDISGPELKSFLEAKGMEARIVNDDYGNPVLYGASGSLRFRVWPHECSGEPRRCRQLDFSAGFKTAEPVSLEQLDAFNETWVFGKAYLADDGTAYVDFPVNLTNGVTEGNMADNVGLWADTMRNFVDYIGWYSGS